MLHTVSRLDRERQSETNLSTSKCSSASTSFWKHSTCSKPLLDEDVGCEIGRDERDVTDVDGAAEVEPPLAPATEPLLLRSIVSSKSACYVAQASIRAEMCSSAREHALPRLQRRSPPPLPTNTAIHYHPSSIITQVSEAAPRRARRMKDRVVWIKAHKSVCDVRCGALLCLRAMAVSLWRCPVRMYRQVRFDLHIFPTNSTGGTCPEPL